MKSELDQILVGPQRACFLLGGISRRTLSYLMARGELRPRRIGRRTLFRYRDLEEFAKTDHSTGNEGTWKRALQEKSE